MRVGRSWAEAGQAILPTSRLRYRLPVRGASSRLFLCDDGPVLSVEGGTGPFFCARSHILRKLALIAHLSEAVYEHTVKMSQPSAPGAPAPGDSEGFLMDLSNSQNLAFPTDLITPKQASRILRVHLSTIYRFVMTKRLPAWKRAGNRYMVRRSDVEGLMRRFEPPTLPPRRPA